MRYAGFITAIAFCGWTGADSMISDTRLLEFCVQQAEMFPIETPGGTDLYKRGLIRCPQPAGSGNIQL